MIRELKVNLHMSIYVTMIRCQRRVIETPILKIITTRIDIPERIYNSILVGGRVL